MVGRRSLHRTMFRALVLLVAALLIGACGGRSIGIVEKSVPNGDPMAGARAIDYYGCGSCHTVPGVPGADALVGPPLNDFYARHYIAGNLENNADNLILWIMNPQAIEPGTAMPDLDVTELDARNIAAYLYSRR